MKSTLRKAVKLVIAVAAGAVLLTGLAAGGLKWLVAELPSHQRELKAWLHDKVGVQLMFTDVDGRLTWRGPELTFREASVAAADDAAPFLTARSASVGLSPLALLERVLMRREIGVDRLTFEGTELTVVQTAEGEFRLQGAPATAARRPDFALDVPPDVEVLVRDSRVVYLDQSRNLSWDFRDVAGRLSRDGNAVLVEASARPPSDFASRIELTAQGFVANDARGARHFTGDWRVSAAAKAIDLGVAGRLLPEAAIVPQAGKGDVAVWLDWRNLELTQGNVELSLEDVAVPSVLGTAGSHYDRIAFKADWRREADEWHIGVRDLAVARGGHAWPSGTEAEIDVARDGAGFRRFALRTDFLRLEDLTPFFWPLPQSPALDSWFALAPRGDVRTVTVEVERGAEGYDYSLAAAFSGLGMEPVDERPGFDSLTGEIRADSRSGRVELHTGASRLVWPALFRAPLPIQELRGVVVWRQGQDAVRVVSDDLTVATPDASSHSSLELSLPLDGSSPQLDLQAEISSFNLAAVARYLPAPKMPDSVVEWLDESLKGGQATGAKVSFVGPLRAFPFDGGEGRFQVNVDVEHGDLAYISDWPRAQDLTGAVEFVNAGFSGHGTGRVLGNRASAVSVDIPDLRTGVLGVKAVTVGPLGQVLGFLKSAPLIAHHLGPNFARLDGVGGTGEVNLDLHLPLLDRDSYKLTASLAIADGELAFAGFKPHASEIHGTLAVTERELHGEGIHAIFLNGPVTVNVGVPADPGYSSELDLEGEVGIDAVATTFDLPYSALLGGQTAWQGRLLIPAIDEQARAAPPKITIDSNLSGVALHYPAPFAKAPSEPVNLEVNVTFPPGGGVDLDGYLGASRRFALQYDAPPDGADGQFVFRRGALRFGGALPEFRSDRGVTIDGSLPRVNVDDWLALPKVAGASMLAAGFAGADVVVADFSAFGQQLGSTKLTARRLTDDWQIELDSDPVAGTLLVPADLAHDPQIVAVMRRLYLNAGEGGSMDKVDPRRLPGLKLHSDEFAIGARRLGKMDAEIVSDPLGLRLVSFESATDGFTAQGSGGWFTGADGDTTRIALTLTSTDVAKGLQELGLDPIIQAKHAEITASVYWPGPPSGDWMDHVGGDLSIRAETGSLLDVQPGAGRVVGLLSISALPRRLALDFRDVFNRGLVFDQITADFTAIDGNAYTDNLKLTGPAAEIGVVGRTGLRDHDYRQQAVVTAEPGKVLPTVGGLLGGPGVAAALLIFTRIFKEPLKGIGRASYCVTGSWQDPMVERLSEEQLEKGAICAELPPGKTAAVATGGGAK